MAVPAAYNDQKDDVNLRGHYGWAVYQRVFTLMKKLKTEEVVRRRGVHQQAGQAEDVPLGIVHGDSCIRNYNKECYDGIREKSLRFQRKNKSEQPGYSRQDQGNGWDICHQ